MFAVVLLSISLSQPFTSELTLWHPPDEAPVGFVLLGLAIVLGLALCCALRRCCLGSRRKPQAPLVVRLPSGALVRLNGGGPQ